MFQLLHFLVIVVVVGELVMGPKADLRVSRPVQLMRPLLLLVVLLAAVWAESQDYYKLLGVNREATTREIRQAFKKLALTMHPDKNPVSSTRVHKLCQDPFFPLKHIQITPATNYKPLITTNKRFVL